MPLLRRMSEMDPRLHGGAVVQMRDPTRGPEVEPEHAQSRYARWAATEHSEGRRIAALIPAGPVFLGLIPLLVAGIGPRVDRRLHLDPIGIGSVNRIVGGLLTALGFAIAFKSIDMQLNQGRGTPLPVMPTQELLTEGPFRYCRNPMTLGTILAYLGMAIAARTTAGTLLVLSLAASLLFYLKRLEEGELAERFGEAYLAYKRETPFIIPRFRGRRDHRHGHAESGPPA